MSYKSVAIIGCGNLGVSILEGLIVSENYSNTQISVTRRNTEQLQKYVAKGVFVTTDNLKAIEKSEIIVFALKPYTILAVLQSLGDKLDPKKHIIVSLAAGISLAEISAVIGASFQVFRAMPNIAASVGESMTCICSNTTDNQLSEAVKSLFVSTGDQIVIDENLMEAATVLGACGIAYVLRFIRAMVQGGIQIGFDAKTANSIVNQTVLGAAQLLIESKDHPESKIDKVTTPKGCTIVGLNQMEHNGFSSALIKGINASFEKIQK